MTQRPVVRFFIAGKTNEDYQVAGPVLIETFVQTPRCAGAVYRAAGWLHVGTTQRRERHDRDKLYDKARKDICLRSLRKDWKLTSIARIGGMGQTRRKRSTNP